MIGLIGAQAANTLFDAVALYPIARTMAWGNWPEADLDRLGFPRRLRFVFPIIKASSSLGLLVGLRYPRFGRLTANLIVAYFLAAIGYQAKAKDSVSKYVPALVMLVWATRVLRSFNSAS